MKFLWINGEKGNPFYARPLMVNEGASMSKTWPFHEKYYAQEKNGGIPDWVK
ncbi:MAG: hypothetical protein KAH17_02610 [Bacteroidales bacterium]|nr:hypothetical protein [Bacteroidales bacterium]